MTRRTMVSLAAVAVCGFVCGCASQNADKPKEEPTMHDVISCVQELIRKMQQHQEFSKNYEAAKSAKEGKLPIGCLIPLHNDSESPVLKSYCRSTDMVVSSTLFDLGIFEMKDDEAADTIKSRIIWGVDGGIENSEELMRSLGKHDAPDFIVTGGFDRLGAFLHLAIHNLHTGKVVWKGFQEIEKR